MDTTTPTPNYDLFVEMLKEERARRIEAERETQTLRDILAPMQKIEMDRIQRQNTPTETGSRRGRITCDCALGNHTTDSTHDE